MARLLNFVLYQVGWFCCVLGAAFSRPLLGGTLALVLVTVHFVLTTDRAAQFKLLVVALGVGLLTDTALLAMGVYRFPEGMLAEWLPPLWMSVLWMQFATTFRYCLKWLSERYVLCGLLACIGAPMAFLGGEKLGAISFLPPRLEHIIALGAAWSLAIPVLVFASDRIHGGTSDELTYRGFKPSPIDIVVDD